ncbi:transcriptional regulator [Curtobacterium sp. MCJR17_055]|nr:transcriptional regulator [Curtobacterium sp. MCBD17_029]PYY58739.1 transcriptional regulator [Curtobacterium sp. MCJR17_055]PYY59720.1 transcriptional regulator [Curtobacterium sp. MCPF17_015]
MLQLFAMDLMDRAAGVWGYRNANRAHLGVGGVRATRLKVSASAPSPRAAATSRRSADTHDHHHHTHGLPRPGPTMTSFTDAARRLQGGDDDALAGAFVDVLPVAGAALSTLGRPFGSAVIAASDPRAAESDEQQVLLGEGPGWSALRSGAPVLAYDLSETTDDEWPSTRAALRATGWAGLLSFPLSVGTFDIGAVTLYRLETQPLAPAELSEAKLLAGLAALRVLYTTTRDLEGGIATSAVSVTHSSGRHVHQATGMVVAQLGLTPENALLVLRARAFADGQPLRAIAEAVIERRIDFRDPRTNDPARKEDR